MFMVKKEVVFFQLATQKISMYNSVLYRKTSKERWVHCLVTKAFFTWPTGVYKKNSLNFKQISVLMLGSLSRWLTIMVVAARWKVSQIWPIFQLIWNQSISLKSLKIIEMFFSKFNFFFALNQSKACWGTLYITFLMFSTHFIWNSRC